MYAVEAEYIDKVVGQYGPATKIGSIVSGQTSVKQPEIEAFERHLPSDVHIISCHSMHGPNVNPKGQPLVIIKHRATQEKFDLVRNILSGFESNFVELSYQDHDRITADTQAVTHAAFLRYVPVNFKLSIFTCPDIFPAWVLLGKQTTSFR
jgi:prephenate dehydrogenase (NADP+)